MLDHKEIGSAAQKINRDINNINQRVADICRCIADCEEQFREDPAYANLEYAKALCDNLQQYLTSLQALRRIQSILKECEPEEGGEEEALEELRL